MAKPSEFVSEIKKIPNTAERVYDFLSNMNNLSVLSSQLPPDKIENLETTDDTCTFTVKGLGETGIQIIEKEEFKTIKLTGHGRVPFTFYFWIQLKEVAPYDTRLRLTLHAELNAMMKMMLKKKLKEGINQIATALTQLPY